MALILDTGVLLAFVDTRQSAHKAATTAIKQHGPPFLTVESVLSELGFLLRRDRMSPALAVELVTDGGIEVVPVLERSAERIRELMRAYATVPMSLADACLVALSELRREAPIATFDSDFHIYRRFRHDPVPLAHLPTRIEDDIAQYIAD